MTVHGNQKPGAVGRPGHTTEWITDLLQKTGSQYPWKKRPPIGLGVRKLSPWLPSGASAFLPDIFPDG